MSSTTPIVRMIEKRQATLERQVSKAEESIQSWKKEISSLDEVVFSLKGMKGGAAGRNLKRAKPGRKRGTWKAGHPGRPPKWYTEQRKAKGKQKPTKKAGKRKKAASAKVLAGLAKARAALAAKRKASKPATEKAGKAG